MAYIINNVVDIFGQNSWQAYQIISSYNIDVEKREITVILKTFASKEAKTNGYKPFTTSKRVFKGGDYELIFGTMSAIPQSTVREGDNLLALYDALELTSGFELDTDRTRVYEDLIQFIPLPDSTDATTFVINGEEPVVVTTTSADVYGDGWNVGAGSQTGAVVEAKIININTSEVHAVLTGPPNGTDILVENFTLPAGTYGVLFSGALNYSWPEENSITISTTDGTLLEILGFPQGSGTWYVQTSESEGEVEGGGEGEVDPGELILGCTDPSASNYNPDAVVDDGSCEYEVEGEVEGEGEGEEVGEEVGEGEGEGESEGEGEGEGEGGGSGE